MLRNAKKSSKMLFPEDSESEGENAAAVVTSGSNSAALGSNGAASSKDFKINSNYAQRYDTWRNKEEVMKVKARYGVDNIEDIQISSSESSSDEEEEWSPAKEKAFFKTLSSLKAKDPKIYDPGTKFFVPVVEDGEGQEKSVQAEGSKVNKVKKIKEKPFLLKDHERTMILEKGGLMSSDEEEGDEEKSQRSLAGGSTLSYFQELDSIKKGFSKALNEIHSDSEEDADDSEDKLLKKRKPKSEQEEREEEEAYRLWLKGELSRLEKGKLSKTEEKELDFLKTYWNDSKLDEGEKFLRDYILNRKYIAEADEEEDKDFIPSYNQIVHDSDSEGLSNDEQFENQREEFEHKYNFRFEEPDQDFIKRFPRTIADSLRREDSRRKKERDSARDRKKEAKDRKQEEVQRLKAMKRREILDKMRQLQEITGDPDLPLEDMDIDGDFDPEEYDRRMQTVFNEKYYDEDAADEKKPEFPFDPEIDDEEKWVPTEDEDDEESNEDSAPKKKKKEPENAPVLSKLSNAERCRQKAARRKQKSIEDLIESSKGRKSDKRKSLSMEAIEKEKPKFDPKVHKTFDKYFKEYYALDFEDLIGDLPCRFKYRKVTPNDFGLSTNEILKGEDRELNTWASLKKTYQYREDDEEKYEAQAYQKKAENEKLKKRTLPSIYNPKAEDNQNSDNDEDSSSEENRMESQTSQNGKGSKTTINRKKVEENGQPEAKDAENAESVGKKKSKRKKKNKKKKNKKAANQEIEAQERPEEIKEELVPENVVKNKKNKKSKKSEVEVALDKSPSKEITETAEKIKKKKKKPKSVQNLEQVSENPPEKKNKNITKHNMKNNKSKGSLKRKAAAEVDVGVEDDRLKAYGLNPKKYKKWVKYGGGQN